MTDEAFKKLEELYLKEKGLRNDIENIEDEIERIDTTIFDLNADNVESVNLRYNFDTDKCNRIYNSMEYTVFSYPKLLAKALESYKQELGFLLADLKHKANEVDGLKELILNMEDN